MRLFVQFLLDLLMMTAFLIQDILASLDIELEKLGVKTTFLHGELEDEIYIHQLEGFIIIETRCVCWKSHEML